MIKIEPKQNIIGVLIVELKNKSSIITFAFIAICILSVLVIIFKDVSDGVVIFALFMGFGIFLLIVYALVLWAKFVWKQLNKTDKKNTKKN